MSRADRDKYCYNCDNYQDALCKISDLHDDEDPNIFSCDLWGEEDINEQGT